MKYICLSLVLLASCRQAPRPEASAMVAYDPPQGKRAVSLPIDKSQSQFLAPGDEVEVMIMVDTPRSDAKTDTRAEILSARAQVLRVKSDWAEGSGLVALALSSEEAQYAALAIEREDRLFLNKLDGGTPLLERKNTARQAPALEKDRRGLAVLVYPDQEEFLAPGDRVDVISSRQSYKAGGKSELTALTLMQDVLVLRTSPPEGNEEWSAVQLMVDPEQAKLLTRALIGEDHLTLAARAAADRAKRAVEPSKMSRKLGTEAERSSPKT